ncbi:IS66 family transposase [Paenisporosarcina sp. NPDC076898]|uniref:IS66 family transposase n=1 Tax=unclassified Paenisporosarcina TaxID=2642018 RepID=UPI003D03B6FF
MIVNLRLFLNHYFWNRISLVAMAISYMLKQWPKLITFMRDGRFEIDNNRAERSAMAIIVMTRKDLQKTEEYFYWSGYKS